MPVYAEKSVVTYSIFKGTRKVVEFKDIKTLYEVLHEFLEMDIPLINSMIIQNGTYKGYRIFKRKETRSEYRIRMANEHGTRKATQKSIEERS